MCLALFVISVVFHVNFYPQCYGYINDKKSHFLKQQYSIPIRLLFPSIFISRLQFQAIKHFSIPGKQVIIVSSI